MQPSVSLFAPSMDGYCPTVQTTGVQAVTAPPPDYLPISHDVHPCTLDVEPTSVAYSPALQFRGLQDVALPPVD